MREKRCFVHVRQEQFSFFPHFRPLFIFSVSDNLNVYLDTYLQILLLDCCLLVMLPFSKLFCSFTPLADWNAWIPAVKFELWEPLIHVIAIFTAPNVRLIQVCYRVLPILLSLITPSFSGCTNRTCGLESRVWCRLEISPWILFPCVRVLSKHMM